MSTVASSIRPSAPLSRSEALSLAAALTDQAAAPQEGDSQGGAARALLAFVMIPAEERIGEWRFAGTATSLLPALHRIVHFAVEIGMTQRSPDGLLQDWLEQEALEVWTDLSKAWSYESLPLGEIGNHQVLLFAEGQAPYDDFGFCVLELPTLTGSPFQDRAPETARPEGWSEASEATDDDGVIDDE